LASKALLAVLLSLRTALAVTNQTNSFINHVLSANGLSNVIPISSRKVERWDIWTKAKVVIGKSNGEGVNDRRALNVFPVLASKALLAVLLSLRTALAVTLALSSSTESNLAVLVLTG
jgi:hypothetical protein